MPGRALRAALILGLVGASLASQAASERALAQATRPKYYGDPAVFPNTCETTASGASEVTDDKGYLCSRGDIDWQTGCCARGTQFDCSRCRTGRADSDDCCETHEACVSCCMAPGSGVEKWWSSFTQLRTESRHDWGSRFEFCTYRCRVHARSTAHENDYIERSHKHCFSKDARPRDPAENGPAFPAGVQAVKGDVGKACREVCGSLTFSPRGMASVNTCNELSRHFNCEAGCERVEDAAAPGYVSGSVGRTGSPAMCLVSVDAAGNPKAFQESDREAKRPNFHRLCACG